MNASFNTKNLLLGSRIDLSKAITCVENNQFRMRKDFLNLMQYALPVESPTLRIAVSGPPGAGKSTLINQLGMAIIQSGLKVAVLPIDPTSPNSGGSILGDKTRMTDLSREPNAFIRPSPSKLAMGGLSPTTREAMYLCEMNGYDVVILETVGVGQGEYHARSMVDSFIVVLPPASGDDLQGLKKGILEVSDIILFNKADGDLKILAEKTAEQYQSSLVIDAEQPGPWLAQAISSFDTNAIAHLWQRLWSKWQSTYDTDEFYARRNLQSKEWLKELISWKFDQRFKTLINNKTLLHSLKESGVLTTFANLDI